MTSDLQAFCFSAGSRRRDKRQQLKQRWKRLVLHLEVHVRRLGRQDDRPDDLRAVPLREDSCLHALAEEGGGRIKPINVTVDFMRGGRDHDTLAAGIITRLGNRVANVEAVAWQDDRARPIASARMNYLIERA